MNTLAVIGMGSIAKRHLSNLRSLHPTSRIYAVSASGKNSSLPEGADAIVSLEQVLAYKPNYAIIACPAPFHVDIAKRFLSRGISVLIEKPLADNVNACKSLKKFYECHNNGNLAVGYCLRFLPSALEVKKYLKTYGLGKIYNVRSTVGQYLPHWRTDKDYRESVSANRVLGGGALLELSHELDYLYWLFGKLSIQHSFLRTTDELGLEVEEIVDLVMLNEQGVHVSVHLDFIQKATQRNCEIVGEHGRIVWDLLANEVTLHTYSEVKSLYKDVTYDKNNMYLEMLRSFEALTDETHSELANLASAQKVVQLVDDAKRLNKWREIQ